MEKVVESLLSVKEEMYVVIFLIRNCVGGLKRIRDI